MPDLYEFCKRLAQASLDSTQKALAILWWHHKQEPGKVMSAGELSRLIGRHGLGNPNSTALAKKLSRSRLTLKQEAGFRLTAGAEPTIRSWLGDALDGALPDLDLEQGYLPQAVWTGTRGYVEKVCLQVDGCYQYGFWDASAVMVRRLVETLIIESYEHLNRQDEIKDAAGNFLMLGHLVDKCVEPGGLSLGREAKRALRDIKKSGDRSAHNRRYNAVKPDLDSIRSGVRVVVDELVNIASLRCTQ